MWIHRRTGPDTAVSYRLGTVLFVLLFGVGVLVEMGWAAGLTTVAIAALVIGVRYWSGWSNHKDHDQPRRDCRHCGWEMQSLRAQERLVKDTAEMERLRNQYR